MFTLIVEAVDLERRNARFEPVACADADALMHDGPLHDAHASADDLLHTLHARTIWTVVTEAKTAPAAHFVTQRVQVAHEFTVMYNNLTAHWSVT
jgi:hypothetical protein